MVLQRCGIFSFKLKPRPSTGKKMITLCIVIFTLLQWSGTKLVISPRCACTNCHKQKKCKNKYISGSATIFNTEPSVTQGGHERNKMARKWYFRSKHAGLEVAISVLSTVHCPELSHKLQFKGKWPGKWTLAVCPGAESNCIGVHLARSASLTRKALE